jgi:geranylgeranyl diphosphate synthase type II
MGLAFQLQDDWLDVYGDSEVFGKNIGGDILCNKKTYMLITALNQANEVQYAELQGWISSENAKPAEEIAAVTHIYNEMGIGKQCMDKAEAYYAEGLTILDSVSISVERKEMLKQFVCSLMNRKV